MPNLNAGILVSQESLEKEKSIRELLEDILENQRVLLGRVDMYYEETMTAICKPRIIRVRDE